MAALLWPFLVAFGGGCHLMGRWSMHDETSAAAEHQFVLQTEPRMCTGMIATRHTLSIQRAMVLCLRTGGCTAILRQVGCARVPNGSTIYFTISCNPYLFLNVLNGLANACINAPSYYAS
jgi:hypothetical protein